MTRLIVAETIRSQIGHKALYMLGAKNMAGDEKSLSFRISGSSRVNYIKVTLNSLDLYDITFGKIWGNSYKVISEKNGIYNDMLHSIIESETGLYTSLGTMGR
jgi:hypothetical protein